MKKVKCIDNSNGDLCLTIGKIYDVIYDQEEIIEIVNDCGDLLKYKAFRFEEVKEDKSNILTEIKWDGKSNINLDFLKIYKLESALKSYWCLDLILTKEHVVISGDIFIRFGGNYKTTLDDVNKILALYSYKIVIEEPKYKIKLDGEYTSDEVKRLEELGIKFEKEKV